jgi:hypothetical protein
VGTLVEYPVALRLPETLFIFDPSNVPNIERPIEEEGGEQVKERVNKTH